MDSLRNYFPRSVGEERLKKYFPLSVGEKRLIKERLIKERLKKYFPLSAWVIEACVIEERLIKERLRKESLIEERLIKERLIEERLIEKYNFCPLPQDPAFYIELHAESFGYVSSGKGGQYYDPSVANMQKQRILKKTGLLKEELDWPGISLIAGSLQKDGYITHDELEQIWDKSQPRRKAVDKLLKVVLGNLSTVSAFMRILNSESDLSYVAGRMNRTQLPAKERNVKLTKRCKRLNRNQKGSVSDAVKKIVSVLRTATAKQKLRSYASKHLNLELKEAFMESFGIMFTFKVEDQLQKLKDPFPTGSAVTEE